MLIVIGALLTVGLVAAGLVVRARTPVTVNLSQLGWMSEKWLAEYHASHRLDG